VSAAVTDHSKKQHSIHTLGWFLVFAVVYADIGTSIFYVPGILYLSIGNLATIAQIITTGVFISIARKYVEICERCPDGGGVVSVTREAFSSWTFLPLLGGALITVDYFLTSAISGVSGLYYLANLFTHKEFFPPILLESLGDPKALIVPLSVALFLSLMLLNLIGIRESASVTSSFAAAKIAVSFLLVASAILLIQHTPSMTWRSFFASILHPGVPLTMGVLATGYADTWLAYSGLESAAQVSGAMLQPVRATASKAMWWVIGTIALLSPPLTATALYILPDAVKRGDPESLMSALAFTAGGPLLGIATVVAASTLLFMACNTAIVGNYHVNVRLADLGFLPSFLRKLHPRLGTPHLSIIISAMVPVVVVLATKGSVEALGDLYAFGLLGTLVISSAAVDRLRWRDGRRGWGFWGGVATTLALVAAWVINMFNKPHALLFGGSVTLLILGLGWLHRSGALKKAEEAFEKAETEVADLPEAGDLLTIEEAKDAAAVESSTLMIALRSVNPRVLETAVRYAHGVKQKNIYLIYVDETPGLFVPLDLKPSLDSRMTLSGACAFLRLHGVHGLPIWRLAEDAGFSIADAANELGVHTVFVGSSKRTFFWRMVKGRMLKRLAQHLEEESNLIIVG
jgi:amino acid transporter